MGLAKRIIWWDFERASWQWDVLCLLIVAFIFLTPKAWFAKSEPIATRNIKVVVQADGLAPDKERLQRTVREVTGDPTAEVLNFTEKKDSSGTVYYDIVVR